MSTHRNNEEEEGSNNNDFIHYNVGNDHERRMVSLHEGGSHMGGGVPEGMGVDSHRHGNESRHLQDNGEMEEEEMTEEEKMHDRLNALSHQHRQDGLSFDALRFAGGGGGGGQRSGTNHLLAHSFTPAAAAAAAAAAMMGTGGGSNSSNSFYPYSSQLNHGDIARAAVHAAAAAAAAQAAQVEASTNVEAHEAAAMMEAAASRENQARLAMSAGEGDSSSHSTTALAVAAAVAHHDGSREETVGNQENERGRAVEEGVFGQSDDRGRSALTRFSHEVGLPDATLMDPHANNDAWGSRVTNAESIADDIGGDMKTEVVIEPELGAAVKEDSASFDTPMPSIGDDDGKGVLRRPRRKNRAVSGRSPEQAALIEAREAAEDEYEEACGGVRRAEQALEAAKKICDDHLHKLDTATMNSMEADLSDPCQWNDMYHVLEDYKSIHGHCLVPHRNANDRNLARLGRWVANQRVFYKYFNDGDKRHIKRHRIAALNKLDFVWNVNDYRWGLKYDELCAYREKHGNCIVSVRNPDGSRRDALSAWCRDQRDQMARWKRGEPTTMSEERKRKLDDIQFEWALPEDYGSRYAYAFLDVNRDSDGKSDDDDEEAAEKNLVSESSENVKMETDAANPLSPSPAENNNGADSNSNPEPTNGGEGVAKSTEEQENSPMPPSTSSSQEPNAREVSGETKQGASKPKKKSPRKSSTSKKKQASASSTPKKKTKKTTKTQTGSDGNIRRRSAAQILSEKKRKARHQRARKHPKSRPEGETSSGTDISDVTSISTDLSSPSDDDGGDTDVQAFLKTDDDGDDVSSFSTQGKKKGTSTKKRRRQKKNGKDDENDGDSITRNLEAIKRQQYRRHMKERLKGKPTPKKQRVNYGGEENWRNHFNELLEFKQQHGHCNVHARGVYGKGLYILGNWVSWQRKQYKAMTQGEQSQMTPERAKLLIDAGLSLDRKRNIMIERRRRKSADDKPPPELSQSLEIGEDAKTNEPTATETEVKPFVDVPNDPMENCEPNLPVAEPVEGAQHPIATGDNSYLQGAQNGEERGNFNAPLMDQTGNVVVPSTAVAIAAAVAHTDHDARETSHHALVGMMNPIAGDHFSTDVRYDGLDDKN